MGIEKARKKISRSRNFAKSGKTVLKKSFIVNGEKQCDAMLPFYHNREVKQQQRRR